MKLPVDGCRVSRILLDFDITVEFDNGATIAFSEVCIGNLTVDEDNQFEGMRAFGDLLDLVCDSAEYDRSGVLRLRFAGTERVVARPRDEVESWEYVAADGSTVLCGSGGDVETWAAPATTRSDSPSGHMLPSIGSTVVRLCIGDRPGAEFSDGARVIFDWPSDSGYLVLRERVEASRAAGADWTVELSSGYVVSCSPPTV